MSEVVKQHPGGGLWHSSGLSERTGRLRAQYFEQDTRSFCNEVTPFTTGEPWDCVFSPMNWTNVPELMPFLAAYEDSLAAAARMVPVPEGFWLRPLPVRVALFFREVVSRHLPVDILEGELIVGGRYNVVLSRCLNRREARVRRRLMGAFLRDVKWAQDLGIGNCGAVPGHLVPDYARVLREGFRTIAAEIIRRRAHESDPAKSATLEAMEIAACAARDLAARYADTAERLAASVSDGRKQELTEIARICRKVPWEPAGTFHEALQSLWLTHMLVLISESYPGPGVSFGRFDQYLYPYLEQDLESGRITRDGARELLRCFWVKPNYAYDYQIRVGRNYGITSSFGQLVTLGGCGPDGEDRTNELTYLCLDVIEEMNLLEPKPNVRLHRNAPDRLWRRVAEIIGRAQGAPFLLNFDEHAMRGLQWEGLPEKDLWDYGIVGCLENTRQGDDRSGTVDVNLNLAKAVELAMFQGRDQATGAQVGPHTPDPRQMKAWAEFEQAYREQLCFCVNRLIDTNNQADAIRAGYEPTPYLSSIVGGCIEKGIDVTAGGARYNFITVEGVALATAADSLAAVKQLVFEQRRVPMSELIRAIEDNFEGHEFLRQTLVNKAPKYGTDEAGPDAVAHDITHWWAKEAWKRIAPATGKRYRAGYLSWNYGIAFAPLTAATPDGRKRGTYLSNGVAASAGRDIAGPTASARSVGRLGLEVAPNGDSHTISLSPGLVRHEEGLEKLAGFLRAYLEEGGTALQINLIDSDTLRKAQADPETYRNLLVRVTGYNAYFVNLGREMQDEIIARLAHGK